MPRGAAPPWLVRGASQRLPSPVARVVALMGLSILSIVLSASTMPERARPMHPALAALPSRMAWAWERDEDLRWLPADAGVAYVAASVWLEGDTARIRPRGNRLQVRASTMLVPIVHVDASMRSPADLTDAQRDAVVAQLVRAARDSESHVVQLDFEARLSQRAFLMDVIRHARAALPADHALSMTALASWCGGDAWLQNLPVDEVVPMAFRMASGSALWRARLGEQRAFTAARCRDAIGTSTDEPLPGLQAPRRYVFSPAPWTSSSWVEHPI